MGSNKQLSFLFCYTCHLPLPTILVARKFMIWCIDRPNTRTRLVLSNENWLFLVSLGGGEKKGRKKKEEKKNLSWRPKFQGIIICHNWP
jgi:hypothetical protein